MFTYFSIRELFQNCSREEFIECVENRYIDSLLVLLMVLDQFRDYCNIPIRINSSYRDPVHNKLVGGVDNSQHLKGHAIDFTCIDFGFESFVCFFREFLDKSSLSDFLGQVIIYHKRKFIHIGLRTPAHKKLTIYDKREY